MYDRINMQIGYCFKQMATIWTIKWNIKYYRPLRLKNQKVQYMVIYKMNPTPKIGGILEVRSIFCFVY